MRTSLQTRPFWLSVVLISGILPILPDDVRAQTDFVREHPVIITPHNVLSVRTDMIRAQAQYMQAAGDFMESAAIARRINADAAAQEIKNHAEWVRTYFELRELNKAYRLREHPPYLDRQELRQSQLERAIVDNPQLTLEGEVNATKLNWLLNKLASTALAAEAVGDRDADQSFVDHELDPGDRAHIVLTDGSHAGGQRALFRANQADVLQIDWPFVLSGPEFDEGRRGFEQARDRALEEARAAGEISNETERALIAALDELRWAFQRNYTRQRRFESSETYAEYLRGKRCLQSLALSVNRVIETNDRRVFDGSYAFEGDSVEHLIRHMCRFGLEFGPPAAGDQGVYRKLFLAMREMYVDSRENP